MARFRRMVITAALLRLSRECAGQTSTAVLPDVADSLRQAVMNLPATANSGRSFMKGTA